jgi:16S rRNA (cytidine1402-2'-O)-methyltransferase
MNGAHNGVLYVVPTPIGNLEDITLRALRVLRETPVIACEDTRVTSGLLRHFEIPHKRLISYFAGNEAARVAQIVAIILSGEDVALVSDAGTPGISDPGTRLIAAAIEAGIRVVPLPGPTALATAVTASGLPTDAVAFEGFLPHKKGRRTAIAKLAAEERTIVFYESPHRIVKTLRELADVLGEDRPAAICRELTKLYEEINRSTLGALHADYSGRAAIKGEFVLVVRGAAKAEKKRGDKYSRSEPEEDADDGE